MKIALAKTLTFRLLILGTVAALLLLGALELGFRQLHQDYRRSLA
jgi:hypothetical protein